MKKTFFFLAALMASAVMMAQTPTVSASKVTLMYCKTTKGTLVHEGVPFTWGEETFTKPGSYVRTIENSRGCDSILTIKVQAPEGAGIAKFNITTPACHIAVGNLIWTSTGTHNTADGNYTNGTFGIQMPTYGSPASGWRETMRYASSGYNGASPSNTSCQYSSTTIRSNITNTYYDWGVYNSITIEGGTCNVGRWRAMTSAQLTTLIGSYGRGAATVEGTNGLIVVPSGWTAPEGLTVKATDDYSQNVFNSAEWAQLETSGAIFLKNGDYCTTECVSGRDSDVYITLSGRSYTVNNTQYNSQCPHYVRLIYVPQAQ